MPVKDDFFGVHRDCEQWSDPVRCVTLFAVRDDKPPVVISTGGRNLGCGRRGGKIPRGARDDKPPVVIPPKGEIFHAHEDGVWPLGLTLLHAESDRTQPPPPRGRAVAMTFDIWSTKRRSGKLQPCVGRGLGIRGLSLVFLCPLYFCPWYFLVFPRGPSLLSRLGG